MPSARQLPRVWQTVLAGTLTVVAAALVTAATASQVLMSSAPAVAVQWGPWNAQAKGKLAAALLTREQMDPTGRAWSLSRAAISRSPGNVDALATFGVLSSAQGHKGTADRAFAYAEGLSRHNRVSELYLIERAVETNDIPRALLHYDHALSTTRRLQPLLLPVLSAAADQPLVLNNLIKTLKRRPIWSVEFARYFVAHGPNPAYTLPALLPVLALKPDDDVQRVILKAAIARLIEAGAYSAAVAAYDHATHAKRLSRAVWDGDFSRRTALSPIDWALHDEPGLSGVVQRQNASAGNALFIIADSDHDGEVARQLLLLNPGVYHLSAVIGDTDAAAPPQIVLACTGEKKVPFVAASFPAAPAAGRRIGIELRVPMGCPAQWLMVRTSPSETRSATPAWIDDIAIMPVRRSS
jgi:hypothetical protein